MLRRRDFLQHAATGLGGIALASLLAADEPRPIRPSIDPSRPLAPRAPHFPPKAKRVVVIFCSGALSHVDTFDYKPELVKRHDTPMPGASGLVTFQGEQGNLIKPLWEFKRRRESGNALSALPPPPPQLPTQQSF